MGKALSGMLSCTRTGFILSLQDSKKPNRKGNSSSSSLKDLPTQNDSSGTSEINNSGASGTNSDLKSAADS